MRGAASTAVTAHPRAAAAAAIAPRPLPMSSNRVPGSGPSTSSSCPANAAKKGMTWS